MVINELKRCDDNFQNGSPDATYENIQFIMKVGCLHLLFDRCDRCEFCNNLLQWNPINLFTIP